MSNGICNWKLDGMQDYIDDFYKKKTAVAYKWQICRCYLTFKQKTGK